MLAWYLFLKEQIYFKAMVTSLEEKTFVPMHKWDDNICWQNFKTFNSFFCPVRDGQAFGYPHWASNPFQGFLYTLHIYFLHDYLGGRSAPSNSSLASSCSVAFSRVLSVVLLPFLASSYLLYVRVLYATQQTSLSLINRDRYKYATSKSMDS